MYLVSFINAQNSLTKKSMHIMWILHAWFLLNVNWKNCTRLVYTSLQNFVTYCSSSWRLLQIEIQTLLTRNVEKFWPSIGSVTLAPTPLLISKVLYYMNSNQRNKQIKILIKKNEQKLRKTGKFSLVFFTFLNFFLSN